MFQGDTIAAVATAMSNAGIGIIRISGPDAIAIADSVFRGKKALAEMESHTISYGHIVEDKGKTEGISEREGTKDTGQVCLIDEVLVSVFRAPRTYTREDLVEINCHGGILILQKILRLLFSRGARPAEPGNLRNGHSSTDASIWHRRSLSWT